MSFSNLILALKGGSGSGNFGHSGRPGKIGGSAAGGEVSLPRNILNAINNAGSNISIYISVDDANDYLKSKGHSDDTIQQVRNLIQSGLGAGDDGQIRAESTIVDALRNDTELGKAFNDQIALETEIHKKLAVRESELIDNNIQDIKENFDWYANREGGSYYEGTWYNKSDWPELEKYVRSREADKFYLYRKGQTGHRPIESWSASEEGAVMGGKDSGGIGWNNKAKFSDLEKQGYKVLAGRAILAGAPGESEITLINMNKLK